MTVMAPADLTETVACTKALVEHKGTAYLRLGRGGEKIIHDKISNFKIGKAIKVKDGERIAIFSTGAIFDEVEDAYNELKKNGYNPIVFTFPTVKPIDKEVIEKCAQDCELIVTCEEQNIVGGFGSAVAEILSEIKEKKAILLRIGIDDLYAKKVGDQKYLRKQYEIDSSSIVRKIEEKMNG